MKRAKKIILLIYITIFLLISVIAYQNRTDIHKWCATQLEACKRDCKLRMLKEQFLRLQREYGPDGAIVA